MIRVITISFFISIIGCNYGGDISKGEYTHLKCNFYADSIGTLFEKKFGAIDNIEMEPPTWYDSTLFYPEWPSTKPLDSFIDIDSYEIIENSGYSKDGKYVYYFRATSDGGQRHVVNGADPLTFKLLDYCWGEG